MPNRMLVEGSPQAYASVPGQTSVGIAAGIILYYNPRRKGFTIQNTGTTVLKLALGVNAVPTQTVYHVALKGGRPRTTGRAPCTPMTPGSGMCGRSAAWPAGRAWSLSTGAARLTGMLRVTGGSSAYSEPWANGAGLGGGGGGLCHL